MKTITQHDLQKHERRLKRHAVTVHAVTTSIITSKLKSGLRFSADSSDTQQYI